MPTITFSFKDLEKLVGRKLTVKQFSELIEKAKGELNNYDEKSDEVTISLDDTNLPYLWSAEGIARFVRLNTGLQKGNLPPEINKSSYELNVDKSVAKIRPYITTLTEKQGAVKLCDLTFFGCNDRTINQKMLKLLSCFGMC